MTHKFSTDATKIACGVVTLVRCAVRDCLRENHGHPKALVLCRESFMDLQWECRNALVHHLYRVSDSGGYAFEGVPIIIVHDPAADHADHYLTPNGQKVIL